MYLQPFRQRNILALWLLACLAAFPSHAQTVYTPTSAWLVGPVTQAASDSKIPCVAVNQFNNGFVFRLSGGGGQLMAMAIDYRQKAFKFDQKYDVEFSVPGQFFQIVTATPYDHETLLFNLYKFPDFYKVLKQAETLVIKTGDQELSFRMAGLKDGLERMESCYSQGAAASPAPPQGGAISGSRAADAVQVRQPETRRAPGEASPVNPLIAQSQQGALTPMPGEEVMEAPAVPVLPEIPPPAMEAAPLDPMAAAASLAEKANIAQRVADQLSQRSPARKEVSTGHNMASAWTETNAMRKSSDIMSSVPSQQKGTAAPQIMRWRALKGSSLRNVIDIWAKSTNSTLIWSGDDFPVTRSMVVEGTFETAVQRLLEQYGDNSVRPVGRLYRDPKSALPVLVIETLKTPQ